MKNILAGQENFLTVKADELITWARKNSLWPYPFCTGCCALEFMAVMSPKYDLARFGSEVMRFSPKQADVLIVVGTITQKLAPILKRIYEQMPEPKWVIAMGACASAGGFYRSYHVVEGIDRIIPVDVYIAGCPPTPEAIISAIMKLQSLIETRRIEKLQNVKADVSRLSSVERKDQIACS